MMLTQRIVSGLVAAILAGALVWRGGYPFLGLILFATAVGSAEFGHLLGNKNHRPIPWLLAASLAFPIAAHNAGTAYLGALAVAFVLAPQVVMVRRYPTYTALDGILTTYGSLYTGLLFSYLVLLRNLPGGMGWLTLALIGTWACDVAAYFVGSKFGRRKLSPHVSPKKTVEGAWGGLLGSLLGVLLVGLRLGLPVPALLGLGIGVGLAAETGDLVESALKRYAGVKDSGRFLPGHGGVLDRCDSLLFVAPFVYYYLLALIIR